MLTFSEIVLMYIACSSWISYRWSIVLHMLSEDSELVGQIGKIE